MHYPNLTFHGVETIRLIASHASPIPDYDLPPVLRERGLALGLEQSRWCAKFDIGLSHFNRAPGIHPVRRERQLEHRIASFAVFRLFIEWRDRGTQGAHQFRLEGC
jgi:hypothetical protein